MTWRGKSQYKLIHTGHSANGWFAETVWYQDAGEIKWQLKTFLSNFACQRVRYPNFCAPFMTVLLLVTSACRTQYREYQEDSTDMVCVRTSKVPMWSMTPPSPLELFLFILCKVWSFLTDSCCRRSSSYPETKSWSWVAAGGIWSVL